MHELIKCENDVAMSKTVCLMSKGMETLIYTTHSTTRVSRSFSLTLTPSPGVLYCSLYGPIVCRQIYVIT